MTGSATILYYVHDPMCSWCWAFRPVLLELRDKLSEGEVFEALSGSEDIDASDIRLRDSVLALISLGYKQADAYKMVKGAVSTLDKDAPVEEVVRRSLVGS